MSQLERILIAGSGGQGVLLIGKLLATVAVDETAHVTFFPAYGAEVRGGTSNCQVVLSDEEIASPVSEVFDSLILLNQASTEKFVNSRVPDGLVILNVSLCKLPEDPAIVRIRATDIANEIGNVRAANFVMLGALLARKPIVPPTLVEKRVEQMFATKGHNLVETNIQAFREGLRS